jgi:hypothetical protein
MITAFFAVNIDFFTANKVLCGDYLQFNIIAVNTGVITA